MKIKTAGYLLPCPSKIIQLDCYHIVLLEPLQCLRLKGGWLTNFVLEEEMLDFTYVTVALKKMFK
jgi:hypothetical protein